MNVERVTLVLRKTDDPATWEYSSHRYLVDSRKVIEDTFKTKLLNVHVHNNIMVFSINERVVGTLHIKCIVEIDGIVFNAYKNQTEENGDVFIQIDGKDLTYPQKQILSGVWFLQFETVDDIFVGKYKDKYYDVTFSSVDNRFIVLKFASNSQN